MQIQNIQISGGLVFTPEILTPSGDPYWANVSLLMNTTSTDNQTNNTFLDGSTNNLTVTRNGTPTQGTFTPFALAPSTSYSTSVNGGSGYFGGSGSYLSVADNAALEMGSDDFTLEAWIYINSYVTGSAVISKGTGSSPYLIFIGGSSEIAFYSSSNGTSWNVADLRFATNPATNTWHHIAVTRSGDTYRTFFNGVQASSVTVSGSLFDNASSVLIGRYQSSDFNGYISNLRLVKGTAVYTSTFTPPTAPVTAISGTSLLLNFTNAGIYDAATKNNLLGVGDTKVSTTQAKFDTTSVSFDGSGDALTLLNNEGFNLGSGDFTIEMWMYMTVFSDARIALSKGWPAIFSPFLIYQDVGLSRVSFYASSNGTTWDIANQQIIIGSPEINRWYHIAITRSGNTFRLFADGNVTTTFTSSSSLFNTTQPVTIGSGSNTAANNFAGFIEDIRITKGVARYTENFTPPTAAFPTL